VSDGNDAEQSAYVQRFFDRLLDIAIRSKAFHRDPMVGVLDFSAFYTGPQLTSAITAAEELELPVEEAVALFVVLTAAADAEVQRRGGFFQGLKAMLPGTLSNKHLLMADYVRKHFFGGRVPEGERVGAFAERYGVLFLLNSALRRPF
jgi:hypothetical protein